MRWLQTIFTIYMIWLLAFFVPAHKRGMITMGPRNIDGRSAAPVEVMACCDEEESPAKHERESREPTQRDIANCAVCFWSAGVLPVIFSTIDLRPMGMVKLSNYFCESAQISAILSFESLPRGPPAWL